MEGKLVAQLGYGLFLAGHDVTVNCSAEAFSKAQQPDISVGRTAFKRVTNVTCVNTR